MSARSCLIERFLTCGRWVAIPSLRIRRELGSGRMASDRVRCAKCMVWRTILTILQREVVDNIGYLTLSMLYWSDGVFRHGSARHHLYPCHPSLGGQAEDIVTMDNGCVCCTVRGDLVKALVTFLDRRDTFDCILLETTGIADPSPIVATFNQVRLCLVSLALPPSLRLNDCCARTNGSGMHLLSHHEHGWWKSCYGYMFLFQGWSRVMTRPAVRARKYFSTLRV